MTGTGGLILLLSMQRSGTNWFMDMMDHLDGTLCLREIFNPRGVFGILKGGGVVRQALAEHLGKAELSERDPELLDHVARHPLTTVDLLQSAARAAGYRWTGFTLFNGQLPDETLQTLLHRPDLYPVLLRRRHLPRHVSLIKARRLRAWKGQDTTGLLPPIDLRDFWDEARRAESWFHRLSAEIPARNTPADLRYEDDVLRGPEHCLRKLHAAIPGFPWQPGDALPAPKTRRQDQTPDVFQRFENGAACRETLHAQGRLAAALAYPGGS